MPTKKGCEDFSWEHYDNHFAIIHKSGLNYFLTVYEIGEGIKALPQIQTDGTRVKWAPRGGSLVTNVQNIFDFFRVRRGVLTHVT